MQCSKLDLTLALVLLVVLSQLSFEGATGLPWLTKSAEIDRHIKEDEAKDKTRAQEQDNFVKDLSEALKQDTAPLKGEDTPGRSKQDSMANRAVDEQMSGHSVVQGVGKVDRKLTRKVLKALRKQRKRKRKEKMLSLHDLFLFQKPLTVASTTNFQDFVNYLKGVGRRIKDFFTKHPVMVQSASEDSVLNQDQSVAELEEKSDAQMQEIEEALIQEMLLNTLKSAASGRVTKRDINDRNVLLQILDGLPALVTQSDLADHNKNSNDVTTLIVKDEALKAIPDENSESSLPTHGTALSIPYTGSSEDMPTIGTAIATTLNQDMQEQN